jgi:hypothetical protein
MNNGWKNIVLPVAAFALVALPAFLVLPALDDWFTSFPIFEFSSDIFRPQLFWRPIEKLNLLITGKFHFSYPFYPHLLAITGHATSAAMIYFLARKVDAGAFTASLVTTLFIVSPAVCAAVWSVDSAIQTWSTAFGLSATLALLYHDRRVGTVCWLALATISVLWKESGISWFLFSPLYRKLANERSKIDKGNAGSSLRRVAIELFVGFIAIGIYFAIRGWLAGDISIGARVGRYAFTIDPLAWIRNLLMLLSFSISTADTLAIFGAEPSLVRGVVTTMLGLPLAALVAAHLVRTFSLFQIALATAAICTAIAPYLPLGRISEMYAHPIIAGVCVLCCIAFARPTQIRQKYFAVAIVFFVSVSLAVDYHKLTEMIRTGHRAKVVGVSIVEQTKDLMGNNRPAAVCAIVNISSPLAGYSVFQAQSGPASAWGKSVLPLWDWKNPVSYDRVENIFDCPPDIDTVWKFSGDGNVEVMLIVDE